LYVFHIGKVLGKEMKKNQISSYINIFAFLILMTGSASNLALKSAMPHDELENVINGDLVALLEVSGLKSYSIG